MGIAISILQEELHKMETSLKSEQLMQVNRHKATSVMGEIAQIKQAIKLLKAKEMVKIRNSIAP